MTLHDRIMALTGCGSVSSSKGKVHFVDRDEAAQIATEADELMAEMAGALSPYAELEEMEGEGANVAIRTLAKYNAYKEQ